MRESSGGRADSWTLLVNLEGFGSFGQNMFAGNLLKSYLYQDPTFSFETYKPSMLRMWHKYSPEWSICNEWYYCYNCKIFNTFNCLRLLSLQSKDYKLLLRLFLFDHPLRITINCESEGNDGGHGGCTEPITCVDDTALGFWENSCLLRHIIFIGL